MVLRFFGRVIGLVLLVGVLALGYGATSGEIFKWIPIAQAVWKDARVKLDATIAEMSKPKPEAVVQPAAALPPAITVIAAAKREVVETAVVTGSLVAEEEVVVGVDLDGQKIVELDADQGDMVKAGQVLARLNRESLDVQMAQNDAALAKADVAISQADTQVTQAELAVTDAQNQLDRTTALQAKGFAANSTLDTQTIAARTATSRLLNARAGFKWAQADRETLVAARKDIMLKLSKTELKAPTDGLVLVRNGKLGQLAAGAGDPIFRIARDGKVELDAEVSESVLHRLSVGQPVTVSPSGFNDNIAGTVRLVTPQVDQATRLGHVKVALPADVRLRVGAFARGEVVTARREVVALPLSAVQVDSAGVTAQVVDAGKVETRKIVTGIRGNGVVEVVSGVREGERVVLKAGTFVRDGDQVTPVEDKPAATAESATTGEIRS
jgi:HlyD family secretion protein